MQARGGYNLSALLWAAGRGHIEVVRLLVERGAKVNVADKVRINKHKIFCKDYFLLNPINLYSFISVWNNCAGVGLPTWLFRNCRYIVESKLHKNQIFNII